MNSYERNLITAFSIIGYLLLTIVVVSKIILPVMNDETERWGRWVAMCARVFDDSKGVDARLWTSISAIVSTVLVIQFWAFFRIRMLQKSMTEAAGGNFPDEQWTFGQIVAVIVFLPVVTEIAFLWRRGSSDPA
jgi:hypothetical protein